MGGWTSRKLRATGRQAAEGRYRRTNLPKSGQTSEPVTGALTMVARRPRPFWTENAHALRSALPAGFEVAPNWHEACKCFDPDDRRGRCAATQYRTANPPLLV